MLKLFLIFFTGNCAVGEKNETTVYILTSDFPYGQIEFVGDLEIEVQNPSTNSKYKAEIERKGFLNGSISVHLIIQQNIKNKFYPVKNDDDICFITDTNCMTELIINWENNVGNKKEINFLVKKHGNQWEVRESYRFFVKTIISSIEGVIKNYEISKYFTLNVSIV